MLGTFAPSERIVLEIAVNTRLLIPGKLEGIGRFTYETLRRITVNHPEHHFYFFFDRTFDESFLFSDNITPIVAGPKARHPILFIYWFEWIIKDLLSRLKPALFLSPDGYLSLRSACKQVPVIHDINFFHEAHNLPWSVRTYYNYFFPKFAARADRIATVSDFSKKDLCASYAIPESRIDVVYNGCSEGFRIFSEQEKEQTRNAYSQGAPYFIYVGSVQPRKNLARLITAFQQFRAHTGAAVKLIIAGAVYYRDAELENLMTKPDLISDVVWTGRVEETELHRLTGSALAMVYVPVFEGFGIPVLEAYKSGIPVIASAVTSLPEVTGDAALLVNPTQTAEITAAMIKLFQTTSLREQLVAKGHERLKLFSWDKTADLLWNTCEKVLHHA